MDGSFANSPRRTLIQNVAGETIANESPSPSLPDIGPSADAFMALSKVFSAYGELDRSACLPLLQHLQRVFVTEGTVLWQQGETSDGLYVVESGVLRAVYNFADRTDVLEESMVGGTLAGELSALANLPRNATVSVEKDAVLWKLSVDTLRKLEVEHPDLARTFVHLVLKVAKGDYDILLSALAARQ